MPRGQPVLPARFPNTFCARLTAADAMETAARPIPVSVRTRFALANAA
jgi:hypothetical protein